MARMTRLGKPIGHTLGILPANPVPRSLPRGDESASTCEAGLRLPAFAS